MPAAVAPLRRACRAGAVAVTLLAGCGRAEPESRAVPPNLVVVLVDALRADRLSLYGYRRPTSPQLDRFARRRAVVFRHTWANAGCTFPSVNSLLTGRWPQRFLERVDQFGMAIPTDLPTLAERLVARGYSSAAVSASLIVRRTPSSINRHGGFERGFQSFDESCTERRAGCVHRRAVAALDRLAEPFFLYLHYLEPHQPYWPPRGAANRRFSAASAGAARAWARHGDPQTVYRRLYGGDASAEVAAEDLRHLANLYDDEVRAFDGAFARLVSELEQRGLLARTIIAVVADHGEELGENGGWGHCRDLAFDSVLATPFLLAVPGVPPGEREAPVSNLDLTPTLLDFAGVPVAAGELDGESLRPVLEGGDGAIGRRTRFAVQGRIRAASDGTRSVRLDLSTGELAGSGTPGGAADAGRRALERDLAAWLRTAEGTSAPESVRRAVELEAELRALGYL